MKIDPNSSRYTAFNTCFGTFKFNRLPMGLSSAPNSFELLMDKVLCGLTFKSCLCYLDDVLVCSETFDGHLQDLENVFSRFRNAGLKLNPQKCCFAKSSCIFLGHHISSQGIKSPLDRVQVLQNYPSPQKVKELRRVLGLFGWFRKFIPHYSEITQPMAKLLRKGTTFHWTKEQENSLQELKIRLLHSEVSAFPQFNLPFYLAVDSSSKGIGYMLYQKHPDENGNFDKIRVVRFGSKALNHWQRSYEPTKLELLGVVTSITDLSSYLKGNRFVVECDHKVLRPLIEKQLKGAIYDRWLAILQQYNFEIRYKPAAQMHVPDALSRCIKSDFSGGDSSPAEDDIYFPYVEEKMGKIDINPIIIENGNFMDIDDSYTADNEGESLKTKVVGNHCISIQIQPNDKQYEISQIVGNDSISTLFKLETSLLDVPFNDSTPVNLEPTLYMKTMNKHENSTKYVGNDCISTNLKPEINLLDMSFEDLKPLVFKSTLHTNYTKDTENDCISSHDLQESDSPNINNDNILQSSHELGNDCISKQVSDIKWSQYTI